MNFATEGTEIAEKLDIKTNKIVNIANACYKMLAKISRLCNRVVQRKNKKFQTPIFKIQTSSNSRNPKIKSPSDS